MALLKHAARDAMDYLEGVDSRSVAPSAEAIAKLSALRGPLPPGPTSAEAVLHLLHEIGSPATMAGLADPLPPCATDSGVVRPVNDVMLLFAPFVAPLVMP